MMILSRPVAPFLHMLPDELGLLSDATGMEAEPGFGGSAVPVDGSMDGSMDGSLLPAHLILNVLPVPRRRTVSCLAPPPPPGIPRAHRMPPTARGSDRPARLGSTMDGLRVLSLTHTPGLVAWYYCLVLLFTLDSRFSILDARRSTLDALIVGLLLLHRLSSACKRGGGGGGGGRWTGTGTSGNM